MIVSRNHKGGRISFASYLVDTFCLGIKDTFFRLRITPEEFKDYITAIDENIGIEKCSYEVAHNWVWGGVDWAEEAGLKPHKDFAITQFMLEEDTDEVPLIDQPFGRDGMHFLMANSKQELNKYLPILQEHLGDDFGYTAPDEPEDFLKESPLMQDYGPDAEYTYQHPAYPTSMDLRTPSWMYDELTNTARPVSIDDETLERILALPADDLRHDLEQIILYHTGLTCDGITDDYFDGDYCGVIGKAIILLGEVGSPDSSLDVVLETIRQNENYYDYHFGDIATETLEPTLYLLGRNRLDKIL